MVRKIEKMMIDLIQAKTTCNLGNTRVEYFPELNEPTHARIEYAKVYLYGNHIGTWVYSYNRFDTNKETLRRWPTTTTKSRLRALGVSVHTKNYTTYVNGVAL